LSRYVCEITGLVGARSEDRAPAPRLAGLVTLWANLHGGHVFGLGLAALFVLAGCGGPFRSSSSGQVRCVRSLILRRQNGPPAVEAAACSLARMARSQAIRAGLQDQR
jgi:hypothetical protein